MNEEQKGKSADTTVREPQRSFAQWFDNTWFGRNIMPAMYAWVRQGVKEAAQILPAFPDSVRPVDELGTLGCPTQYSVNQEQGVSGLYQRDQGYDDWLDQRAKEAAQDPPKRDGLGRGL